ncbi:Pectin acetylesterase 8, partial [Striga hermonthica]
MAAAAAGQYWLQILFFAFALIIIVMNNNKVNGYGAMVPLTLLSDAVAKGAVCLDGSPAGYHYFEGFGNGANSWLVYLMGGGWCSTTFDCQVRVQNSPITSSTNNIGAVYFDGILSPDQTTNPDFYNWNKVYLRYCDVSSFIGDVKAVDPATNLHYRGSTIFGEIVKELLTKGLQNAQNVILAGNSAGGLAAILNCDRFRAMVPNDVRVKCISDSGFFIQAKDLPNAYQREAYFAQVVELHGIAKFLSRACKSRMASNSCFWPENVVRYIKTPLFLLNSAFDKYQ